MTAKERWICSQANPVPTAPQIEVFGDTEDICEQLVKDGRCFWKTHGDWDEFEHLFRTPLGELALRVCTTEDTNA